MTDTSTGLPQQPFGVGNIISESFSTLFGNFIKIVLIAAVPTFAALFINGSLTGFDIVLGLRDPAPDDLANGFVFGTIIGTLVSLVLYAMTTALLVQLAYDTKLGRPTDLNRYIAPAVASILPVAVLSFVAGIMYTIGFMLLVVPGLWLYAVFSVTVPAIVIERVGFGGLGRSAALTKNYRWPIVGAVIVMFILIFIVQFIGGFIISMIGSTVGVAVALILMSLITAVGTALLSIAIANIYARLREIKEGVSVDQIVAVFD